VDVCRKQAAQGSIVLAVSRSSATWRRPAGRHCAAEALPAPGDGRVLLIDATGNLDHVCQLLPDVVEIAPPSPVPAMVRADHPRGA
jgi:hypothetical protein